MNLPGSIEVSAKEDIYQLEYNSAQAVTRRRRRWGIVLVVVVVLASGFAAGAAGIGDSGTTPVSIAAAQDDSDDDEEDPRHEHPDDADGDGDDDELGNWLSDQLSESLGDSTVELSEGEYESAREVLGDDYDDRLGQFVEVDGDTDADTEDDDDDTEEDEEDDAADAFEEAKDEQEEFIDAIEEYEETLEEYEQALEAGDEERARELARELDSIENRVTDSGTNLVQAYRIISEETPSDLSEEQDTISERSEDVSQTQDEIEQTVFVATELHIETDLATGSFDDPLLIEGELTAADDTALDDERILIEVDGRTTETTTDDGTFELEYRPALLDSDAESVTVEFAPDPSSQYLRSSADVPVDITAVEPTIDIDAAPESASYADEVTVRGTAHVDGTPVDQLPVQAQLGDQFQGTTARTADDGTFNATVTVPAAASDGTTDIVVAYDTPEQAFTPSNASTQIQIVSTPTRIEAEAEASDDTTVSISGTLSTEDDEPVAGQSVRLTHDGSPVGTVETTENGNFEDTIEFSPESIPDDEQVGITIAYDSSGTNLEDSEEQVAAAVSLPDAGSGDTATSDTWPVSPWNVILILGIIGLVTTGSLYVSRRVEGVSLPDIFDSGSDDPELDAPVTEPATKPTETVDDTGTGDSINESATPLLDAGRPNEAVIVAYEQARNRLTQRLDTDQPRTYWEFYQDWRDGIDSDSELLRALTEQYERATFSTDQIAADDANEAIQKAVKLAESESTQ